MPNQELHAYIDQQLKLGLSKDQITTALMSGGWHLDQINQAFAPQNGTQTAPPQTAPGQDVSPVLSSLPSVGALFGQAFSLYKERFWVLLGVTLFPLLIIMGLVALAISGGFLAFFLMFSSKFAAGGIGLLIGLFGAFFIFMAVTQAWGQTALLCAIAGSPEKIGVIQSYRRGWHKIHSFWWITLIGALVALGGLLLLVVPAIIFGVWFSLALFILVGENLGGFNALLQSKEYVKGHWGRVFVWLLCLIVVSLLILIIPFIVFTLTKNAIAYLALQALCGLTLPSFALVYTFCIYRNLRGHKGQVIAVSSAGKKAPFIFVALLGLVLLVAPFFFGLYTSILLNTQARQSGIFNDNSIPTAADDLAADVRLKNMLYAIRASAELYYNKSNSYGPTTDSCDTGMFASPEIATDVQNINHAAHGTLWCSSNGKQYAMQVLLNSKYVHWCIDSSGAAKEEDKRLSSSKCE